MADIAKFFEAFSERAYKENDLSDVTYAMCEADVKFRQFFLDFFFKDAHLDARKVTIEREHYDKDGRPDFWIKTSEGTSYIVEVKIWDGQHHFDDYFKILSNGVAATGDSNNTTGRESWHRLGYIANYESVKDVQIGNCEKKSIEVCRVATWKEFLEDLSRYSYFDDSVVEAYAGYVRRVCPFEEFTVPEDWTICVDDFRAIKAFDGTLKDVINNGGTKLYTGSPRWIRSMQWMGRFFEWKITSGELSGKTVWGWLGARYTQDGAVVCVEFEDRPGWGDLICKRCAKYVRDGTLRLYARNTESVASDGNLLKSYFDRALSDVANGGPLMDNDVYCVEIKSIKSVSKPLLAMKCLPFAIENHFDTSDFVSDMAAKGYEFAFVYEKDQEIPGSHCGRHFELRKIGNGTAGSPDADGDCVNRKIYRGWIGVNYSEGCKRPDGRTYSDNPVFTVEISKDLPAAESLPENSWGWKCLFDQSSQIKWGLAFSEARKKLLALVSK